LQQRSRAAGAYARSSRNLIRRIAAQGDEVRNVSRLDAISREDLGGTDTGHFTRADGIENGGAV
jgi:hypothetical protein